MLAIALAAATWRPNVECVRQPGYRGSKVCPPPQQVGHSHIRSAPPPGSVGTHTKNGAWQAVGMHSQLGTMSGQVGSMG